MLQVFEDHAQFVSFSVTRRCGSPETSKPMQGLGCKCYPIVLTDPSWVFRGGRSQRYLRKKTVLLSDELLELGGGFKYFSFSPLFGEDSQFDDHIFQRGWNHKPAIVCNRHTHTHFPALSGPRGFRFICFWCFRVWPFCGSIYWLSKEIFQVTSISIISVCRHVFIVSDLCTVYVYNMSNDWQSLGYDGNNWWVYNMDVS